MPDLLVITLYDPNRKLCLVSHASEELTKRSIQKTLMGHSISYQALSLLSTHGYIGDMTVLDLYLLLPRRVRLTLAVLDLLAYFPSTSLSESPCTLPPLLSYSPKVPGRDCTQSAPLGALGHEADISECVI